MTLQWRHNGRDSVSNHQPHDGFPTVYSGTNQGKHLSSASLAFARGIHRRPVNSPHKTPVTQKIFSFDDVIMNGTSHSFHAGTWYCGGIFQTCETPLLTRVYLWRKLREWQRTGKWWHILKQVPYSTTGSLLFLNNVYVVLPPHLKMWHNELYFTDMNMVLLGVGQFRTILAC